MQISVCSYAIETVVILFSVSSPWAHQITKQSSHSLDWLDFFSAGRKRECGFPSCFLLFISRSKERSVRLARISPRWIFRQLASHRLCMRGRDVLPGDLRRVALGLTPPFLCSSAWHGVMHLCFGAVHKSC